MASRNRAGRGRAGRSRRGAAARSHPAGCFASITLGAALLGAAALSWYASPLPIGWAWLAAINGVAFLTYGYDKAISGSRQTRVPEVVLLALAVCGGTVGAWLGRVLFRHKTQKANFVRRFRFVAGVQAALLAGYWLWRAAV